MKKFIKFCLALMCGVLLLYTAYLIYIKFFRCEDGQEADLYAEESISFSERVKKAAEKQLEKIG